MPDSAWTPYITAGLAFLGALAGAGAKAFFDIVTAAKARKIERDWLATAFAGEIRFHLETAKVRRRVETAHALIDAFRTPNVDKVAKLKWAFPKDLLEATNDDRLLAIYKTHIGEIGRLGAISHDIMGYYSRIFMVDAFIKAAARGQFNEYQPQQIADLISEELEIWKDAERIGKELVTKLSH